MSQQPAEQPLSKPMTRNVEENESHEIAFRGGHGHNVLLEKGLPQFLRPRSRKHGTWLISGLLTSVIVVLVLIQSIVKPAANARSYASSPTLALSKAAPCASVPWKEIKRVQNATDFSVYAFANGQAIEQYQPVTGPVCILIAVPQKSLSRYHDVPVQGKGPDNLHLLVMSSAVTITFEPPRPLGSQVGLDQQFTDNTLVYYAETNLFDAGSYEIQVDQEWSNWEWGNQWANDLERNMTVYASGLEVEWPDDGKHGARTNQMRRRKPMKHIYVAPEHKHPKHLTVASNSVTQTSSNPILQRPLCSMKDTAAKGRWYSNSTYAKQIPSEAFDEWGYAWVGDTCRLDYYDQNDAFECLKHRRLHTYGDSNLRRLLLVLFTAGGFCRDVKSVCQSSDQAVKQWAMIASDQKNVDTSPLTRVEANTGKLKIGFRIDRGANVNVFGRGSSAVQAFTETMTMNWQDWVRRFYDTADIRERIDDELAENIKDELLKFAGPAFDRDKMLRPDARARVPPEAGPEPADLVLLSFGAWDEAFTPSFDDFARTMPHFRDAIMEAYPPTTQFVMKMTNGISCMKTFDGYRRYSGTRIQHMHDIVRDVFRIGMDGNGPHHGLDGRLFVIDPLAMNGRCDAVRDFGEEFSNHQRFSQIRTEAQMLLNAVCERDPESRKLRWRGSL